MAAAPLRDDLYSIAHCLDRAGKFDAPITTTATYLELTRIGFVRCIDRKFRIRGHVLNYDTRADVVTQGLALRGAC